METRLNTHSQNSEPPSAAPALRIPLAAYLLILISAGAGAFIVSYSDPIGAIYIILAGIAFSLIVSLTMIFNGVANFTYMARAEQAHAHALDLFRAETARMQALPAPRAESPPPALPEPSTILINGVASPRNLPLTVKLDNGTDVRVDILERFIELGFCGEAVGDYRDAMRERYPEVPFKSTSLTAAREWLAERGATDPRGKWLVDRAEALGIVYDARLERAGIA